MCIETTQDKIRNDLQQHSECPTFNKYGSRVFHIRYQVLLVLTPFFWRPVWKVWNAEACINLLVLFKLVDMRGVETCLLQGLRYNITHSLIHSLRCRHFVICWPEWERLSPTPCWNSNRARRHIGIVTVQSVLALLSCLCGYYSSSQPEWWFCSFYTTNNIRSFAKLKWSWLRMFKLVLWPTWRLNFISIWLVRG